VSYTDKKINQISTLEKLFFWNKVQYTLLNNQQLRRMVFVSPFGTGKTVLLKAKAKQLVAKGEKVAFVFIGEETLLQKAYQQDFLEAENQVEFYNVNLKGK
jgi:DNA replication protein DnaC